MNDIQIFKNEEFGKVRTVLVENEPYFVGKDVAEILGYSNTRDALKGHVDEEDKANVAIYDGSQNRNMNVINESGLYSLIFSSKLPNAKKFKRWVTNEVLPSIRKEGAYITDKANPEMLREKADKLENLSTLNETAKIMISVLERAGLKPQYQALTLKQIYRKGGIDIPIEDIKADKEIYDLTSIADTVGIYSSSNKPHGQAINAIISNLNITDEEKEIVSFERNGHMGTTIQYTKSVIDKVQKWLLENNYPLEILYVDRKGKNKTFHVSYRTLEEVAVCQ